MEDEPMEPQDVINEAEIILKADDLGKFVNDTANHQMIKAHIRELLEEAAVVDVGSFPILKQAIVAKYMHSIVKQPDANLATDLKWAWSFGYVMGLKEKK